MPEIAETTDEPCFGVGFSMLEMRPVPCVCLVFALGHKCQVNAGIIGAGPAMGESVGQHRVSVCPARPLPLPPRLLDGLCRHLVVVLVLELKRSRLRIRILP